MTDAPEFKSDMDERLRPFASFLVCLHFLTRLPVPFLRTLDAPNLAQSMPYFASVGALIGGLIGASLVGFNAIGLPSLLSSVLALAMGVLLTGALHEDGIADVADGFGGGKTRERRLEIMKDSRIGTYGTLALITCMMARVFIYETLLGLPILATIGLMAGAGAFSRAMMVDLLWATKSARDTGLSVYAGRPSRNGALFALLTGGGFVAALATYFIQAETAVIALIASYVVTVGMRNLSLRLIGGQTGDVCGAVQVLTEIAILSTFVASIN